MPSALPVILIIGLFVVVGTATWITTIWGLLTGGPRDKTKMGQPYLYDRLYYLLFLILTFGWTFCLVSVDNPSMLADKTAPSGFLVGWGIMAIGMGLFYRLRLDMMLNGAEYLSKHGFILARLFYALTVRSFRRQQQSPMLKILPLVFLAAGIGVLLFNLPHIGEAFGQAAGGARNLIGQISRFFRPA